MAARLVQVDHHQNNNVVLDVYLNLKIGDQIELKQCFKKKKSPQPSNWQGLGIIHCRNL